MIDDNAEDKLESKWDKKNLGKNPVVNTKPTITSKLKEKQVATDTKRSRTNQVFRGDGQSQDQLISSSKYLTALTGA